MVSDITEQQFWFLDIAKFVKDFGFFSGRCCLLGWIRDKSQDPCTKCWGNTLVMLASRRTILSMSIIWAKFDKRQRNDDWHCTVEAGIPPIGDHIQMHNYNRWVGSWNPFFDCYHTFIAFNTQKVRNGITCYQMSRQFLKSVPSNGIVPFILHPPQTMPNIPLWLEIVHVCSIRLSRC